MERLSLASLLLLLVACVGGGGERAVPCETRDACMPYELCVEGVCELQDFASGAEDADFDGIPDRWEGIDEEVDTDGDGVPDYLDDDSDGDGFLDVLEGAGADASTPPPDADGDGTPDYLDTDTDGNGIPDADEGSEDLDGDGTLDFRDPDDDGDFATDVQEIAGDAAAPADFDGDGTPDYRDLDSDGDSIGDLSEGVISDTDMDEILDRYDDDSDGDGIPDSVEAGDDDVATLPVDTDGDLRPDFQDRDADNDGLSDAREVELGSSPTSVDSDEDGVPDIVEVAACFAEDCADDITNPESSVRTRGDFVFVEPYMEPNYPERDTLGFATDIQTADVYFLMDTTGSMGSSVDSLKASISDFLPQVRAVIPDVWVGLGQFKDYTDDPTYENFQNLTPDIMEAQTAANRYTVGGGRIGLPEALVPAIYATLTGLGLEGDTNTPPAPECPFGFFGAPCFRSRAIPIIVGITDQPTHNGPGNSNPYDASIGPTPQWDDVIALMNRAKARFIGIGQGTNGQADLEAIARATDSVDGAGRPFYTTWSGGAIGDSVLDQIGELARSSRLDIEVRIADEPGDSVNVIGAFVSHLEANIRGDAELGCGSRGAIDDDGDGILDVFPNVPTMTSVCFDVVTKPNTMVEPTEEPQLFRATVRVVGDGITVLDEREVIFLVPPVIEDEFG